MNEKNDLIVLNYSFEKTRVSGNGQLEKPPYDKVRLKLKDGKQIYEKEFSRFQLANEIATLQQAGKGVPFEYVDILKFLSQC